LLLNVTVALKVRGNKIVTDNGASVKLRGASHSGTEFACIQGYGIFDGQVDDASIIVMKSWKINIVRVPINEDCWLGINGVKPEYSGNNYKNALNDYVNRLTKNGMSVIVDLHWTAPGNNQAKGQNAMLNQDHSVQCWKDMANFWKNNLNIIFDVHNEPYPDNNAVDSQEGWRCWRDGGTCSGFNYQAAGMQLLVDTIRGTGASNILLLGGINYANSLTRWLDYKPRDPLNNLAASWHSYNFNYCKQEGCWNNTIGKVAKQVPVIVGELGEDDCAGNYIVPLMQWLDREDLHYLAWTWNTWNCNSGPALITDYNGNPTTYGRAYRDHIAN